MALLESLTSINPGTKMPTFSLPDPDGNTFSLPDLMGEKGLIIAFTCNHCPYAIAIWDRLIALSKWASDNGVETVAINPNINPSYPDDNPSAMKEKIEEWDIPFPYLVDEYQSTARDYKAQCTPDLYLLDKNGSLIYHGRLDDNWRDPKNVTKEDLKEAVSRLVNGSEGLSEQYPSMGCSIKWC